MNIFKLSILIVLGILVSNYTNAQSNKVALSLYKKLGYKVSIPKFQSAEGMSLENMTRIANAYRLNHDTPNAELWYSHVVNESNNAEDFLHYAQALQSNGNFDTAKEYFLKYDDMVGGESNDKRGALLAASIDRMSNFKNSQVEIKNEEVLNTKKLDFSPMYFEDKVIFVSTRDEKSLLSGIKDIWIDDNFMALWESTRNEDGTLTEPEVFSENITTKFHEGPLCFNKSGDRVFFTRNDFKKGRRRNNSKGIMKLQIYTSTKEGDEWSKPSSLNFNTKEYEEAHPALTPDGRRLYFSSDREGGFGGMDLYVSEFTKGEWSAPVNLGENINTAGNDVFPYVHEDGTLYFSSNGWEGLGGLDLYEAKVGSDNTFVGVDNIGTPFNSTKDDFGLIMNKDKTEGYLTSAREGGHGQDDIYSWRRPSSEVLNKATICAYEAGTDKRLSDVEVTVNDPATNNGDAILKLVETTNEDEYILKFKNEGQSGEGDVLGKFTNNVGTFTMPVKPNTDYEFVAKKEGYKIATESMNVSRSLLNSNYEFCIPMEPINCLVLEGIVKNKKLKNTIPNATVTMVNKCTGDEVVVTSDANGDFDFPCVDCDCEYYLKGEKSFFTEGTNTASTMGLNCAGGGKVEVLLELTPYDPAVPKPSPIVAVAPTFEGTKIAEGAVIELPHIYYDFDQFYIRDDASSDLDRVVNLMNQYPTLSIELGSHTDARGTEEYNRNLSQNRANAAVQYIVKKGISAARLVAKGYGESQLRNGCANFIECPETEHQYNRRTEVRVLRFNDPNVGVKYLKNLPIKIDKADPTRNWIWN